jgi:plastocyanin
MPTWSVKIVQAGDAAAFVPDLQGAKAGDPLQAEVGDNVSWGNLTEETHQPWKTDESYQQFEDDGDLCDPIDPQDSSRSDYAIDMEGTVYYRCKTHADRPSERGSIIATTPAPAAPDGEQ